MGAPPPIHLKSQSKTKRVSPSWLQTLINHEHIEIIIPLISWEEELSTIILLTIITVTHSYAVP